MKLKLGISFLGEQGGMMPLLTINTLGTYSVASGKKPITDFESTKVRALLVFLAVESDRPHSRDSLAGLLWPEYPQNSALNSLRNALANLRKAIGDHSAIPPYLHITRENVQFNKASECWLDLTELKRDFSHPEEKDSDLDPTVIASYQNGISLYRGRFLEDFFLPDSQPFEEWAILKREQINREIMQILRKLVDYFETIGDYAQALSYAWRQVDLERWQEEGHQQLMRLLALSGRRSEALIQYDTCTQILKQDLGVEPSSITTAIYEAIRDGKITPGKPLQLENLPFPGESPYKGMQFFDEDDADLFFGRERLTARLIEHLRQMVSLNETSDDIQDRFLAVIGASGSGKSSILRAGLVAAIKKGMVLIDGTYPPENSQEWLVHIITPTAHPVEMLGCSLISSFDSPVAAANLVDDMLREPRSLYLFAAQKMLTGIRQGALLLIVDQFEELFTLCRSENERKAFIDNLLYAAKKPGPVIVIIALRADFYAHCARYQQLRQVLSNRQEYIGPMDTEELRSVIEKPARISGWQFQAGLVDLILREAGEEPGALPLLSHALLETWRNRKGRTMTLEGYSETGGVSGAIVQTADSVFKKLTVEQQTLARRIFLRLTDLGEGTQETRRKATLNELVNQPDEMQNLERVLGILSEARLVILAQGVVEVAHEALIQEWSALRQWLDEDRESLRIQHHLSESALAWDKIGRDSGELYRGARLARVLEWAAEGDNVEQLNPLEREYLISSQQLEAQEIAEREAQHKLQLETALQLAETQRQKFEQEAQTSLRLKKRALHLAGALLVVFILAFVAVMLSFRNAKLKSEAEQQTQVAFSRELIAAAGRNLQSDPELSNWLALYAVSVSRSAGISISLELENMLHLAIQASRLRYTLLGHTGGVWSATYSPDGMTVASGSADKTIRLWNTLTGREQQTFSGHQGSIEDIDFSPDGNRLASVSVDGTLIIWNLASGEPGVIMNPQSGPLWNVAFSSNGRFLVVSSEEGSVTVWDVSDGRPDGSVALELFEQNAFAIDPDSTHLATGGYDAAVHIWDIHTGQEVLSIPVETNSLLFSPDGTWLATVIQDKVIIWDVESGQEIVTLCCHAFMVSQIAFSPDGMRLATAGQEGVAKIWDAETGEELISLFGHTGAVDSLDFSPECSSPPVSPFDWCGRYLITGGRDGSLRLWDVSPAGSRELLTSTGMVGGYSEDGERLYIADLVIPNQLQIHRWDISSGSEPREIEVYALPLLPTPIVAGSFSPDHRQLAVASYDGTVQAWNVESGQDLVTYTMAVSPGWVTGIDFVSTGLRLSSVDGMSKITIWDVATNQALFNLPLPDASVSFSRDGMKIATGDLEGVVKVWDGLTGQELFSFAGHNLPVNDVAFSPDGKWLASGGMDSVVKVWDLATRELLFSLPGHTSSIFCLEFSPDGKYLSSGSFDGTTKVWDVHSNSLTAGQELHHFSGAMEPINFIFFSPDGKSMGTGGYFDQVVRVYTMDPEELINIANSRLTRKMTAQECQRYLHLSACP